MNYFLKFNLLVGNRQSCFPTASFSLTSANCALPFFLIEKIVKWFPINFSTVLNSLFLLLHWLIFLVFPTF